MKLIKEGDMVYVTAPECINHEMSSQHQCDCCTTDFSKPVKVVGIASLAFCYPYSVQVEGKRDGKDSCIFGLDCLRKVDEDD